MSLNGLKARQQFAIIAYRDEPIVQAKPRLYPAVARQRTTKWLFDPKLAPTGNTRPEIALALAMRLMPDEIFLLSDGVFLNGSKVAIRKLVEENQSRPSSQRVIINTVGVDQQLDDGFLEWLATATGGKCTFKLLQGN
jgi:hypothetical protein